MISLVHQFRRRRPGEPRQSALTGGSLEGAIPVITEETTAGITRRQFGRQSESIAAAERSILPRQHVEVAPEVGALRGRLSGFRGPKARRLGLFGVGAVAGGGTAFALAGLGGDGGGDGALPGGAGGGTQPPGATGDPDAGSTFADVGAGVAGFGSGLVGGFLTEALQGVGFSSDQARSLAGLLFLLLVGFLAWVLLRKVSK